MVIFASMLPRPMFEFFRLMRPDDFFALMVVVMMVVAVIVIMIVIEIVVVILIMTYEVTRCALEC